MSVIKIRELLLKTLDDLSKNKIDRQDAQAIASISQTYMNSIKLEIEAYRSLGHGFKLSDVFESIDVKALNVKSTVKYLPGMRVKLFNKMIGIIKSVDDANMKVCITDSHGFTNDHLFEEIEQIIN